MIKIEIPTSFQDIKNLWNAKLSIRHRHNIQEVEKLTAFFVRSILSGRWSEVSDGEVIKWTEKDKKQFTEEMKNEMHKCICQLK